jgi:acyl-[acyl-carrier-protein]-phospholipid O-acyltransferase/long-chain-fatty-acid--[acyl-carrier-protein] ligase
MLAKRLLVSAANSLSRLAFRVRAEDVDRVPRGAAVLLTSEVSLTRALAIHRASARPVHFWWDAYAVGRVDRLIFHWLNIHTVFPNERSLAEARPLIEAQLRQGALVCSVPAFASDRETVSTAWLDLLREAAAAAHAPFVSVGVDLRYDRHVRFSTRTPLHHVPPRLRGDIAVSFRAPLDASSGENVLLEEVQLASHEAYALRRQSTQPLHRTFIDTARRNPFATVCYDQGRPVSRFEFLARAVAMASSLADAWRGSTHVGFSLPSSAECAYLNLAAALAGKVSVNVNFEESLDHVRSVARQAGLKNVVSSRSVRHRVDGRFPEGVELLWTEDLAGRPTLRHRVLAAIGCLSPGFLERRCGATRSPAADDILAIVFSSGTTSEPKGIMLTHYGVMNTAEQLHSARRFTTDDVLLHSNPFFHVSGIGGFTFMMLGLLRAVMHETPPEAQMGALCRRFGVSKILATPSALREIIRENTPSELSSLRHVLSIGQKLPAMLAAGFMAHCGTRPVEIYGLSEMSGCVTACREDVHSAGRRQFGWRPGYAGRLLGGVAARIVDPKTFERVPAGKEGLILLRGARMAGYLHQPEKTSDAFHDGWYITGDLGWVDALGFFRVTDRLARHSGIEGMMVSHVKVEELLQQASGSAQSAFCVTSVLYENHLEQLAVVHTHDPSDMPRVLQVMRGMDVPPGYVPRIENCIRVEAMPQLGNGKVDVRSVMRLAAEQLGGDYRKGA